MRVHLASCKSGDRMILGTIKILVKIHFFFKKPLNSLVMNLLIIIINLLTMIIIVIYKINKKYTSNNIFFLNIKNKKVKF